MTVLNLLVGLNSVILIFLVVNVFKPFIGSYASKKGENLATKEDIAQLTKIAEGIKAEISDKVWDRQKQWEMRRDAVSDAWRALRELESSLISLRSAFSLPIPDDDDLKNSILGMRHQAAATFDACNTKYLHAKDFADLIVGDDLPKRLAAYFQQVGIVAKEILKGNAGYFTSVRMRELSEKANAIVQEARRELDVKRIDCAVV